MCVCVCVCIYSYICKSIYMDMCMNTHVLWPADLIAEILCCFAPLCVRLCESACVHVYVQKRECVRERKNWRENIHILADIVFCLRLCVCGCVCVRVCERACVCVCVCTRKSECVCERENTQISVDILLCLRLCVCVCVRVCVCVL